MSFKRHPGNLYGVNEAFYDAARLETQFNTESGNGHGDGYGTAQQGGMDGDVEWPPAGYDDDAYAVGQPYQGAAIQNAYEEITR